ncbi:MATE family efflux transporter [Planococcus shenhongbingii]|uniref:Probable multidrug resistance protein NorM n=1 Tax=Planococcus shenhongbingii TaxID=3058398 RepID=A0ABT8NBB6_9BACL|nr:MATE family efflux transporter [Planococcus sp. N017]MDN7245177.1 MATE family efflux transporter [Planococcus sp. N017]
MTAQGLVENRSTKEKLLAIVFLAVPAMIENILQTVVGFVDTLFIAKVGLLEVTAVGVANAVLAIYLAIFMAMGIATSSLIARSIGAGDMAKAKAVAKQSMVIALAVGAFFGLLTLVFAEFLIGLFGAEARVVAEGATYLRIVGIPSVFISLMLIFGSILRGAGDTKTPMNVAWGINLLHIPLDYVLIFGVGDWTGWGVAGAAWATVIVRIIGTFALYAYIQKSAVSFSLWETTEAHSMFSTLFALAAPAAAERLIMRLGQVLYFGLIVVIGTKTFAAHTIAGNIEMFSYMPGYGLAVAAATLVGQYLGAGKIKEAYQYGLLTMGVAVGFMSVIGVFLFLFAPWLAALFTQDPEAVRMVAVALRIDAFAQPALAVGLVLTGALQGAGDTKSPMYSTAIGMWLIRIVGIYVLGIYFGLGIAGIWLAIALDILIRAIFLFWRYRHLFKKLIQEEQKSLPFEIKRAEINKGS